MAKSDINIMSITRLNIPTHDDPLSSQTQIPEFMDRVLILRENDKVSRASRCFESDLSRFSEKVEASRTVSFRDQEIFPMVSGDVPRYTKEV